MFRSHLSIISALLYDLRRHPVRRTDEGVALGHCARQLRCYPKVCNLDSRSRAPPMTAQKYVSTLDVSMDLTQGVQISKTLNEDKIILLTRWELP